MRLSRMQHPQMQKIELRSTVHLALQILQTGDLPLDLPVTFYQAGVPHRDTARAPLAAKAVRYGITFHRLPDEHPVEPCEKQIARWNEHLRELKPPSWIRKDEQITRLLGIFPEHNAAQDGTCSADSMKSRYRIRYRMEIGIRFMRRKFNMTHRPKMAGLTGRFSGVYNPT